jgi:molybdopterin converting factor small subunit
MTIDVLLFGPMAARAGTGRIRVRLPEAPPTCSSLREALARDRPELADHLPLHRFAVNARFAGEETVIREGDEVALIGMVSGG